jgi:hypothetical protein
MLEQTKGFPYKSKRNILVFGTNLKWLKTLNQYVIDITYYEETSKSDYSAKLRSADVIWYHPKIKKHANQDKLLKMVRKHKKDLKYFNFKGPKECAKEIILYEEEGKYISRYY